MLSGEVALFYTYLGSTPIDLASKEFAIDLLEFNRQQLTSMIVNFKPKE
jgi:hypothetical protein